MSLCSTVPAEPPRLVLSKDRRIPPACEFRERGGWPCSVCTQSSTRSQLRKWLLPALGKCALKDLDGQRLQVFVSDCHASPKTIRNLVATLRMMWSNARAWGYVAHDPFDGLVLPKPGLVHTFTFSLEEIKRIIGSASEPHRTFYCWVPGLWNR
jgi:hypothetical protein